MNSERGKDIEEAIEMICGADGFYLGNGIMAEAKVEKLRGVTLEALRTQQERDNAQAVTDSHPCEYCAGKRVEIGHSYSTKMFIDTFGKKQTLETECDPCPDYARCSMRHIPARTAFLIHYCPMCGRKLDDADERQKNENQKPTCDFAKENNVLSQSDWEDFGVSPITKPQNETDQRGDLQK